MDRRLWLSAAGVWGFAEATAFFIVPDVLLTAAVLAFGFVVAIRFAIIAALAATAGGLIMLFWGARDADGARAFLLTVPLIGEDLLMRASAEIQSAWAVNAATGAITGAPYKIYAVEAGASGLNPLLFGVVSFAARFARFALTIAVVAAGAAILDRYGAARWAPFGLGLFWAAIYGVYLFVRLGA